MADTHQPAATKAIRKSGLWSHKFTDAYESFAGRLNTPSEPGKADMVVLRGDKGCFVEVKDAPLNFAFNELRENQREWIALMQQEFNSKIWIFLVMGTHPPNYNREKYPCARRAWLLPVDSFFQVEKKLEPFQRSLPMLAGKGYRTELQQGHLDAIHMLTDWELVWESGGWCIPVGHSFIKFFKEGK